MICLFCAEPFELKTFGPRNGVRYCSQLCKGRARRAQGKGYTRLPQAARVCLHCGATYLGTLSRRFCTAECATKYHAHMARVRVRAVGASRIDDISRGLIFARSAGRCGICAESVDLDLDRRHPMGPTVDHIIPLARGGTHTYGNTQLAHRACNARKGARVAA